MLIKENGIKAYDLPEGVTVHTREDDKNIYVFIENYSGKEQSIEYSNEFEDIEGGNIGLHKLGSFDVRLLKNTKQ